MVLKEIRKAKGLTQDEAAFLLGMSRRSYFKYETDPSVEGTLKYRFYCETLNKYGYIDETHGVLTVEQIANICADVFKEYNVEYCYLFGSYAKGKATETSDVDLLVSAPISGLRFFELIETLREKLRKKVDVLDLGQLDNNTSLVREILKDGIRICG